MPEPEHRSEHGGMKKSKKRRKYMSNKESSNERWRNKSIEQHEDGHEHEE